MMATRKIPMVMLRQWVRGIPKRHDLNASQGGKVGPGLPVRSARWGS
jgi:hypothetical protein